MRENPTNADQPINAPRQLSSTPEQTATAEVTDGTENTANDVETTLNFPGHELTEDFVFMIPVSDQKIHAEPMMDAYGSSFTLKPEFHISVLTLDKAKLMEQAVKEMALKMEKQPGWKDKTREMAMNFWGRIERTIMPERFATREKRQIALAEKEAQEKVTRLKAREKELMEYMRSKINVMLNQIDWNFDFTDEAFHIQRDRNDVHQETIIRKAIVPGMEKLYARIKNELGVDLGALPFPHVTLYTREGDNMGIGVYSEDEFQSYQPKPVQISDFEFEKIASPLSPSATFEEMTAAVPELAAMNGLDQQNNYHALTLLEHTATFDSHLKQDEFVANHPKRDLIHLAARLHDIGKTAPESAETKDDGTKKYPQQNKFNNLLARKVLKKYFDLNEDDTQFVLKLIASSTTDILDSFSGKEEIKSSDLQAFLRFLDKLESLPGDYTLEEKVEIVMHFNLADKAAHYNETTLPDTEANRFVIENTDKSMAELRKLQEAFPAIIEAVRAKKAGNQKAAVQIIDGKYTYVAEPKKKEKPVAKLAPELEAIISTIEDPSIQKRVSGILGSRGEKALPQIAQWVSPEIFEQINAFYNKS